MDYGWLSIVPPLLAISLAIITKEVLSSLFIGIFAGAFILQRFHIIPAFIKTFEMMFSKAGDPGWNTPNLIFVSFLGALIAVITAAGGSKAFGEWASKKIKSRKWAQGTAWVLGMFIFIDDYFNSLTIGAIMRPVTDRFRISRAKLAYILDSTAAPVCIIAPISSWIAYVMSLMADQFKAVNMADLSSFSVFLQVIPFNLYAILTIIMVGVICFTDLEFGPMAKFEYRAIKTGQVQEERNVAPPGDDFSSMKVSEKGRASDLIVPLSMLIVFTIIAMIFTGGYFEGGKTIIKAFEDTNAIVSLVYSTFLTLILCALMFIPRGLLTFNDFMGSIVQGIKSMVPAFAILILAWSIGGICSELGTGAFVASLVAKNISVVLMPMLLFLISCIIAFSTGTSWGTFAIMIPIAIPLAATVGSHMLSMIAAVLAGGIYGDHVSPISDTTILSSTGAACHHIDHVTTQLPYGSVVAAVSCIGFLLAGFIESAPLVLIFSLILLLAALKILHNLTVNKQKDMMKDI